jgi:uncharacterized protein YbjT (DUF2867 family)
MGEERAVAVFGASGHTGGFVVRELRRRGLLPVACGRDAARLHLATAGGAGEVRTATLDAPESLDRAFRGVVAVINAAGPFAATSTPVIEAALRARVPYVGVAAEPDVVADAFERHDGAARAAGVPIAPACGFYGGLGDLLATAAMGDWAAADQLTLAFALSSWRPTAGTRATIAAGAQRRGGRRLAFRDRRLELRDDEAPPGEWAFPAPVGTQPVATEFTTADCVTMARHLRWSELREYMTLGPLGDLQGPLLEQVADGGRSDQRFLVEAVARRGGVVRRAVASGIDIYAVSAPLAVLALEGLLATRGTRAGVLALAELWSARTFLEALRDEPASLTLSLP